MNVTHLAEGKIGWHPLQWETSWMEYFNINSAGISKYVYSCSQMLLQRMSSIQLYFIKKMQTYKGKKVTGFMQGSSLALEANFTHFHTFYCHFMLNYLWATRVSSVGPHTHTWLCIFVWSCVTLFCHSSRYFSPLLCVPVLNLVIEGKRLDQFHLMFLPQIFLKATVLRFFVTSDPQGFPCWIIQSVSREAWVAISH